MRVAVFSGGGARCAAQLGYMSVLYEKGIYFEGFSGSSGGAVVGALLAKGYLPNEALEIVKKIDYKKIKLNLSRGTLFCHKSLREDLIEYGLDSFSSLKHKLFVTVTDFNSSKTIYLDKGDLADAILASCALLPLFCPVKLEDGLYIDGGLSDNLPVTPFKKEEFILAINVNPLKVGFKNTFLGNFKRAGYIMLNSNVKPSIALASHYVEIKETIKYGILEKRKFDEIFEIGKIYAKEDIKKGIW